MFVVYPVLLGTTVVFLLMILPCNNPCGSASVAYQETVEMKLFLRKVVQAENCNAKNLLCLAIGLE